MKIRLKNYLLRPETGAGLLFAAVALGTLRLWALHMWHAVTRDVGLLDVIGAMLTGTNAAFFWWTIISFTVAAFLSFLLLRRRLSVRSLKRVLLIAAAHAAGAVRFHDVGLMVLSVLPLFALIPALMMPRRG